MHLLQKFHFHCQSAADETLTKKARIIQHRHTMYPQQIFPSFLLLSLLLQCSTSTDTITPNQPVKDGDVLVSQGEVFALGFFSPGFSKNRHVGIWYNKVSVQTVVWVANRDNPTTDTSGVLSIDRTGNLVLHQQSNTALIWSTNVSAVARATGTNQLAQLLDTGNLVLFQDSNTKFAAWQSFDYPTNTLLPQMKFGVDKKTGLNRFLTSWNSFDDPGSGKCSFKLDINGKPECFLYKNSTRTWRSGPWDGLRWSGVPEMTQNFIFNVTYVENQEEVFMSYRIHNASVFSRMMVNESGTVERLTWHEGEQRWVGFWSAPKELCDDYSYCGAFGNCDPSVPNDQFVCTCLPGFEPRLASDWYLRDGSKGCKRKQQGGQLCGKGDGFVKLARVKVPDTSMARVDENLELNACQDLCLRNCSCTGFANADIRGSGSGCITWYGDLVDTRQFLNGGQDLYIRVDSAVLAEYARKSKSKKMVAVLVACAAAMLLIIISGAYWLSKRRKGEREQSQFLFSFTSNSTSYQPSPQRKVIGPENDLPVFELSTIIDATDHFSLENKLGEGGFGSVYKGKLHDGQLIAIKRLSKNSGQGIDEFKNEVTLIAKLQHRNLVRLLGCCIQKAEKMLIYEYLPNKGLDSVIFDKQKGSMVDWRKRFEIILGIVRGMIYLHQDSRLRIIHRDLKASNVLLDADMKPKISDFGMARIFGGDQIQANTNRVVGTYGYMSPEYAMEGLFSIKSDIFSFGVLLLEIISGTKNSSYYQDNSVNLIGHVWDLWKDDKALNIVDSSLGDSYEAHQVLRCIHIGLLCVQEFAGDRPTMPEIAFMLCNETALPSPAQPAFIFKKPNSSPLGTTSASLGANSVDTEPITIVEAR